MNLDNHQLFLIAVAVVAVIAFIIIAIKKKHTPGSESYKAFGMADGHEYAKMGSNWSGPRQNLAWIGGGGWFPNRSYVGYWGWPLYYDGWSDRDYSCRPAGEFEICDYTRPMKVTTGYDISGVPSKWSCCGNI